MAPSAPSDRFYGLNFLQELVAFKMVNKKTAESAIKKSCVGISERSICTNVSLCFLSFVSIVLKQKIFSAMKDDEGPRSTRKE